MVVANTATHKQVNFKNTSRLAMSRSLLNKRHSLHATWESTVMIFFTSQGIKHLFEEPCQKSKMDTAIDFVKTPNIQEVIPSWKSFRKIWNRRIITLVVWMIKLYEKTQDKYVLLNYKIFEKIKQVSSTKLTNWYKNISCWKQTNSFINLFFLDANLKVSKKILLKNRRASFRKNNFVF